MAVFNVVAAFDEPRKAKRAVQRLEQSGVEKSNVHVLRPGVDQAPDRVSELRAEMQDEVTEGFGGPGVGFMTPSQAEGAMNGLFIGTLMGGLVGLAVGVLWALFGTSPLGPTSRALLAFIPFAIAGAITGVIA